MQQFKLGRSGKVALVDDDFQLPEGSLVLSSHGYPKIMRYAGRRRAGGSCVYEETYLHHLVAGKPPAGMEVDHINGDKLDARRENLRICTRGQNARNIPARKGKFLGVYKVSRTYTDGRPRFASQITHQGRCKFLGVFLCEKEAAAAYNTVAAELHGEFARLNMI